MGTTEERLAALEERVASLETRLRDDGVGQPAAPASTSPPVDPEVFWALHGLRQRVPDGAGAVLYTGSVRLAEGERYEWQYGLPVDALLGSDWTDLAGTLTALAHPVRLQLLREILAGRRGTAELAELDGVGTGGQLHHHLRQLISAGWLRTAGRGRYVVPPERVVPLLAVLTAAHR